MHMVKLSKNLSYTYEMNTGMSKVWYWANEKQSKLDHQVVKIWLINERKTIGKLLRVRRSLSRIQAFRKWITFWWQKAKIWVTGGLKAAEILLSRGRILAPKCWLRDKLSTGLKRVRSRTFNIVYLHFGSEEIDNIN